MLPAVLRFRSRRSDPASRSRIENRVHSLLASLWKNGQVGNDWVLGWTGSVLAAHVGVPAADALEDRHTSERVADHRRALRRMLRSPCEWELLADAPAESLASWESAKSLLLTVRVLHDADSPVSHGEAGTPVPLYSLPLAATVRESIQSWGQDVRGAEGLWLSSLPSEVASYRLLADPTSPLMRIARGLSQAIEKATGRATYAFLFRHYALRGEERLRPCPLCGGEWKQRAVRGEPLSAICWPFRCDDCRIVSEMGVDEDEPALAAIGTFRPRRGRRNGA